MTKLIPLIENYKHIIWDWNGTLMDDVDLVLEVIGDMLSKHSLPIPSRDEYRNAFGFPVSDYYLKLGFNFELTPFSQLADQFITAYYNKATEAPLYKGARETLQYLHNKGVAQSILSASAQNHLDWLTNHYNVTQFFQNIYGISDHYARSKIDRGMTLIAQSHISPNDTLLIGDTDHDFEVATKLGINILTLADGHQDFARLSKLHKNVIRNRFAPQEN